MKVKNILKSLTLIAPTAAVTAAAVACAHSEFDSLVPLQKVELASAKKDSFIAWAQSKIGYFPKKSETDKTKWKEAIKTQVDTIDQDKKQVLMWYETILALTNKYLTGESQVLTVDAIAEHDHVAIDNDTGLMISQNGYVVSGKVVNVLQNTETTFKFNSIAIDEMTTEAPNQGTYLAYNFTDSTTIANTFKSIIYITSMIAYTGTGK